MTLTRATLGNRLKRKTTDIEVDGDIVRMQKPTPREYSQYQAGIIDKKGEPGIIEFSDSLALLTARMWIDGEGNRLFSDLETKELVAIDLDFYEQLSEECRKYAKPEESKVLGESDPTIALDSPAESALSSG